MVRLFSHGWFCYRISLGLDRDQRLGQIRLKSHNPSGLTHRPVHEAFGQIALVTEDGSDLSHAGDDISDQSGSRSSDQNQDRFDRGHMVPREHRAILFMKPSGGLGEISRMVTAFLKGVTSFSDQPGSRSVRNRGDTYPSG
jgi:hypothetical protein